MKLYNRIFERTEDLLRGRTPVSFPYEEDRTWPLSEDYEMIMRKDSRFELGSGKRCGAAMTCVTDDESYVNEDCTCLYGPDLPEIKDGTDYFRISQILIRKGEAGESANDAPGLCDLVRGIDFVRFHVYTKGFMIRTSGQSVREQVRVSGEALEKGISFSRIGNTFIRMYMEKPEVERARVIFITAEDADFSALEAEAVRAADIRRSLSGIGKGLPRDCAACSIKEICSEVEGLKELHFGYNATS